MLQLPSPRNNEVWEYHNLVEGRIPGLHHTFQKHKENELLISEFQDRIEIIKTLKRNQITTIKFFTL